MKSLFRSTYFALIVLIGFLGFRITGPVVERAIYAPVARLEILSVDCARGRLRGVVDKASYFGGLAGRIIELNVYSHPEKDLIISLREDQLRNRSAGVQFFNLDLERGCPQGVTVNLRHISPVTGLVIPSAWGPFENLDGFEAQ